MMTEFGPTTLVDGNTYTSINGRVFLPNIRRVDGWATTITVRNNTSSAGYVTFTFRDAGGGSPCGGVYALGAAQVVVHAVACASAAVGYVDSTQDITVNVVNKQLSPNIVSGANEGISATYVWGPFSAPIVIKRRYTASGMADSQLLIQNATTLPTTIQVQLIGAPGSGFSNYTKNFALPSRGAVRYNLRFDSSVPDGWYGSAVVSNGTFAVASDLFNWDGLTDLAFNAFPPESKTSDTFIPLFMVRRTTLQGVASTPINVQNVTGGGVPIAQGLMVLNCTAAPGSGFNNFIVSNPVVVNDNASYAFNPVTDYALFPVDGWLGSCRLTVPSNRKMLALAQIRYPQNYNASFYEALRAEGADKKVLFPTVQKRLLDGSATAITVQNLSPTASTTVTFYYRANPAACPGSADVTKNFTIPAGESIFHNHRQAGLGSGTGEHGLPDGWCGSLRVESSNQPIDGFAQLTNYLNNSGDSIMAHNAVTRP
jgi:hypothetical protein